MTKGVLGSKYIGSTAERSIHVLHENDVWLDTDTNHMYWYHSGGWVDLSSGSAPGGAAWGGITGTLSAQTDLQNALNGKAASSHAHAPGDVTGTAVVTNDSRLSDARTPLAHNQASSTITDKASANGVASLDANTAVVQAIQRLLSGTGAVTTTEGYTRWNSTTKRLDVYDAVRERSVSNRGWLPAAYPVGFVANAAFTTALALAANGGSVAVPILVTGNMLLESVSVRNTDIATARTWGWDLYEQFQNSGSAGENSLTRIAACSANETFTPTVASTRTLTAGSAPVFLGSGCYWLVIQSRHATSTFGVGTTAVSAAFALNLGQTKTTVNPNGATLDFVAVTWAKITAGAAVRLNGRVFGQAVAF